MKYNLCKLSEPGFDLSTNHIDTVIAVLERFVCTECRVRMQDDHPVRNMIPSNYESMSPEDKLDHLLSTPCGAEFLL